MNKKKVIHVLRKIKPTEVTESRPMTKGGSYFGMGYQGCPFWNDEL